VNITTIEPTFVCTRCGGYAASDGEGGLYCSGCGAKDPGQDTIRTIEWVGSPLSGPGNRQERRAARARLRERR
jgi:hypothetical protein